MAELSFTWDSRDLSVWRGGEVEKALFQALKKSGGDAARFMRTGSSRLAKSRKRFKTSAVLEGLPLAFPKKGSTIESLAWRMSVSGKPVPVVDFPHRQIGRGVSVSINAAKRTLIPSAFLATMKSGHRGVFLRAISGVQGPLTKRQTSRGFKFRVQRLPIEEAFSTRLSDVFKDVDFVPFIQTGAQKKFSSSFGRLLPLELDRLKRGR